MRAFTRWLTVVVLPPCLLFLALVAIWHILTVRLQLWPPIVVPSTRNTDFAERSDDRSADSCEIRSQV